MSEFIAFLAETAITIFIFAILTLSVNIQYGAAGIFNFGIVAFFLIGAYASAYATLAGLPFVSGVAVGAGLAAVVGFLISLPAINLRGDYLALATFMFAEIINLIILNVPSLGGAIGLASVPSAFPWINSYPLLLTANLLLSGLVFLVLYIVYRLMMTSPYGRAIRAMRENENLAESLGKNTFRYKAQIFIIGSIIAGIDGALYSQYLGFAGTELFTYAVTFTAYIMSIIGGSSTGIGALLGSFFYIGMQDFLRIAKNYMSLPVDPNNLTFILFGLATVAILYYRPDGLIREEVRKVR